MPKNPTWSLKNYWNISIDKNIPVPNCLSFCYDGELMLSSHSWPSIVFSVTLAWRSVPKNSFFCPMMITFVFLRCILSRQPCTSNYCPLVIVCNTFNFHYIKWNNLSSMRSQSHWLAIHKYRSGLLLVQRSITLGLNIASPASCATFSDLQEKRNEYDNEISSSFPV